MPFSFFLWAWLRIIFYKWLVEGELLFVKSCEQNTPKEPQLVAGSWCSCFRAVSILFHLPEFSCICNFSIFPSRLERTVIIIITAIALCYGTGLHLTYWDTDWLVSVLLLWRETVTMTTHKRQHWIEETVSRFWGLVTWHHGSKCGIMKADMVLKR